MKAVMFFVLPYVSVLIFFISVPSCLSSNHASIPTLSRGFSAKIINRYSRQSPFYNPNLTRFDRIQASIRPYVSREQTLSSTNASLNNINTQLRHAASEYIMEYYIGTPPVRTYGVLDTGSSLTWRQCLPCEKCSEQTDEVPIFDPAKSSTYHQLSCVDLKCGDMIDSRRCSGGAKCLYAIFYVDGSYSIGIVAQETLIFLSGAENFTVPNVVIGCSHENGDHGREGIPGIIGLSKGPASIISQFSYNRFSHCFGDYDDLEKSGYAKFGEAAIIDGDETPMHFLEDESHYYVSLEGISVDNKRLSIPNDTFSIKKSNGGCLVDSGTTFTYLVKSAFDILVEHLNQELENVKRAPEAEKKSFYKLCYEIGWADLMFIPVLALHFTDADLHLPSHNTWIHFERETYCLAILPTNGRSTLGNFQMQGTTVGYDLDNKVISFNVNYCAE